MAKLGHLSRVLFAPMRVSINAVNQHCGALILNEPISATYEYLLANYGPLLTLKHLAEVMHATPNGLRMAIVRHRQPLAAALADAKRQVGRRLYFEARVVADAIDLGLASPSGHGADTKDGRSANKAKTLPS